MHNIIVFYTFIALIIFFVAVEIYRAKCYLRGIIIEFCPSITGIDNLILSRLKIKLEDGKIIEAEASRCTMCMGRLTIGDEINVIKSNNRYIVNLPIMGKKKLTRKITCTPNI